MAKTSKNKKPEELKLEDVLMECRNCTLAVRIFGKQANRTTSGWCTMAAR